jgi:hypothetical protein
MTRAKKTKRGLQMLLTVLLLAATTLSAACGPSGYVEPISKFQSSSAIVIASARLYVSELNKVERDHYILGKLSQKGQIRLNELEDVQVFSREGLKARLDALDQLAKYGNLLSKLAKSDAGERVQAETKELGNSISELQTTVNGLTHADDAAFKAAAGPVTSIIGEILNFIVERKIQKALDEAIRNGHQPINNLIGVIRSDIAIAYQRKRNSLSAVRTALVDEYNNEMAKRAGADPEKLRALAEKIRDHEDRWEVFATANPGEGLDAMAKAHTALVEYAQSAHKINDLASLASAMEAFAARAVSIGQSVQALRQID